MKNLLRLLVFVLFLGLPAGARALYYYRGTYQPPKLPEVESFEVTLVDRQYAPSPEQAAPGAGRVVIDRAHGNNLEVDDLAHLNALLKARGAQVEAWSGLDRSLGDALHGATALVVLAPTSPYAPFEQQAVVDFVADGGRLLLAADPTRQVLPSEQPEFLDLAAVFFPDSAIPAANSLAGRFDLVFFEDYLYDMQVNQGNYRNVIFSDLSQEAPLTENLEELVFFASHSIEGPGTPLAVGGPGTRSNVRTGASELTPAMLAADGRVLALGDLTLLTPPFHGVADNPHFLARLADWLAQDGRDWDLEDFPYLYSRTVDLVQIPDENFDPRLLPLAAELESALAPLGLSLNLRLEADPSHDALYVGSFDRLDPVLDLLATAGVSVTVAKEMSEEPVSDLEGGEEPPLEESELAEAEGANEVTIDGLGTFDAAGTSLFVTDRSGEGVVLLALAEDGQAAIDGVRRLIDGNFFGCLSFEAVTLCSTGEGGAGAGLDAPLDAPELPPLLGGGQSIFVLSDDDGPDGVRTGAEDFAAALGDQYAVTVWSTSVDGIPSATDVAGYDAYIIDSGDFAYDDEDFETFFAFAEVEGGVMFIGAQPLPSFSDNLATLVDLQVTDESHPLGLGFALGEMIELSESLSGVPALVLVGDEFGLTGEEEGVSVVFARGPNSPQPEVPVVVASEEGGERVIFATFAFYRMPEEARQLFALNAAAWLLGE